MKVGIPREIAPGERRVAATPDTVKVLQEMGFEVQIERGAGLKSSYFDEAYEAAGATLVSAEHVWGESDLVLKLEPPTVEEAASIRQGAHLISFIWPGDNDGLVDTLKSRGVTCIAMENIPRITRAQKMDARSSMDNIRGYRAVIEAANEYGGFFTGQITAAGRISPATVLIVGAGVAGLAALGAARGLGAIVKAFDVRPAVKDQVESLGGEFLEVSIDESGDGGGGYAKTMSAEYHQAQMDLFYEQAKSVDIVITTALIPGRDAPILWETRAVEAMKPGSIVVDIAAPRGGNCELTKPGEVYTHTNDVKIVGYEDLPSRMSHIASQLYGTNLCHLLKDMTEGGQGAYRVDLEDEVVRGAILLQDGAELPPPPKVEPSPAASEDKKPAPKVEVAPQPEVTEVAPPSEDKEAAFSPITGMIGLALVAIWGWLNFGYTPAPDFAAPAAFLQHLTVFVLAVFVGWQVIWSVTAALHTPLMSVTNAISGIIIVGGLLQVNGNAGMVAVMLGIIAAFFATINIAGGFLVTKRMLRMFRK
ncbi:MAG: Re/Si-specific NAD(P)(+) transhydrogenase subunit alpha [Myxococcota bacterium]|nr:Re/Si-specific NAD(P)(+) transhydrogenase subunit alpha [Myxococcota bacterium]